MLNDIIKFIQLTIIHFFETSKTIVFDNFFNYTFEYKSAIQAIKELLISF